MYSLFRIAVCVICLFCLSSTLFAGGKHKKERREERRTERDRDCDDDLAMWDGPRSNEEIWFDNDGEFRSSRDRDDRCGRDREDRDNRDRHRRHNHRHGHR